MAHWNIYSPVTFPAFGLTIQNLTANVLTLLTQTILSEARGLARVIPFCLILPAWRVAQSITVFTSEVTVLPWKGDQWPLQHSVHSHVHPSPLTMMLFIGVRLFRGHSDSYMSTLMVPSCLREVMHGSVTSLPYLHTCLLSPILSFFSLFPVRGSRLGRQSLWWSQSLQCVIYSPECFNTYLTPDTAKNGAGTYPPLQANRRDRTFLFDHIYDSVSHTHKNVEKYFCDIPPNVFLLLFRLWIALFAPFCHLCLFEVKIK